jgi:uncharacterized protein
MQEIYFEWNPRKAAGNARRHGVTFEEAMTVFDDPLAQISDDETHSVSEFRESIIGHSTQGRLLVTAFVETSPGRIRIISARQVSREERARYEQF